MFKGRVRAPTYDELEEELLNPKLIVMNRPIKIPRLGYIQNIDDVDFNDFDLNNHNLKTMIEKVDKETQKNYELQNHDLFPEMYEEIDATGSNMGNDEKRTQTKRFTPKGFDIYSSANPSSSDKPSSPPSPHHISRPTTSESSEQEAPKKKGFGFFNSREWDMYSRLRTSDNEGTQQSSSSSSSSSSALPSNVHHLTREQMARSRSHSSQSSGSGKKK